MSQLALGTIMEHSVRERQRAIHRYITLHRDTYRGMATLITPDPSNASQVWARLAFAILSANAPFEHAVGALAYCAKHKGRVEWGTGLERYAGMVPAKVDYVNALPLGGTVLTLTRHEDEPWHDYRMRLYQDVAGLGLCKASFAAALMDPIEADVACVDTHIQRVYLGHRAFKALNRATYLEVEDQIRRVARQYGLGTFLTQWLIWDHARGRLTDHAVFPGAHK